MCDGRQAAAPSAEENEEKKQGQKRKLDDAGISTGDEAQAVQPTLFATVEEEIRDLIGDVKALVEGVNTPRSEVEALVTGESL